MFESKYSGFLTALLIIIIIGIVGLLGYLGYSYYQEYNINRSTSDFVDSFMKEVGDGEEGTGEGGGELNAIEGTPVTSADVTTYKGFNVVGTIEIPATDLKYPILEKVTKASIEAAVAVLYGPGPNQPGNTVIAGHNYRNGLFFSNNKNLETGDKVYITDMSGNKVTYTIYNKFEAAENDTSFFNRDTQGGREVTLSTCTDDSKARIIIEARADEDGAV